MARLLKSSSTFNMTLEALEAEAAATVWVPRAVKGLSLPVLAEPLFEADLLASFVLNKDTWEKWLFISVPSCGGMGG